MMFRVLVLVLSIFVGSVVKAETLVVLMRKPLTQKDIGSWSGPGKQLERVSPYSSDYFRRLYRLKGDAFDRQALLKHPLVEKVEVSQAVEIYSFEEDPLVSEQWYLRNTGQSAREEITDIKSVLRPGKTGADLGWMNVKDSLANRVQRSPRVAILDTGIDYEHEDLAHSIYLNEAECVDGDIPLDEAENDLDGNGYKGDCKGISLVDRDPLLKNRPLDQVGHGTHLAGLISAKWGNRLGIEGVYDGIKLLPVKTYNENERRQRVALSDRVAEGILYAVTRRVDVINLSLGWPISKDTEHVREAIREARRQGVFVVAAAGNNAHSVPVFPCAYNEVICVGSKRNDGKKSDFSNFGPHVDVYAPGEFMLSTYPSLLVPEFSSVRNYEVKSGTSQAAPLVAAGLAVLKASRPADDTEALEQHFFRSLDSERHFRLDKLLLGDQQTGIQFRLKVKDLGVLPIDTMATVKVPLKVQRLIPSLKSVQLQVKAKSPGIKVLVPSQELKFQDQDELEVQVEIAVASLETGYRPRIQVQLGSQVQNLDVGLSRLLSAGEPLSRLKVQESQEIGALFTLPTEESENPGLYYVYFERNKEPAGLKLKLWRRGPRQIEYVGEKVLESSTGLLAAYQMDANGDGEDDIVVMALGSEKLTEDSKPHQVLHIHYLSSQLEPLVNQKGLVKKPAPPIFNFALFGDAANTRWRLQDIEGMQLKLPYVVAEGRAPEVDQSLQEKRRGGLDKAPHLYYLEAFSNSEGQVELQTRIFDRASWAKSIRKRYRLRYYEDIEPLFPLGKTDDFIIRIGQMANSRYLRTRWAFGEKVESLAWPRALLGYRPVALGGADGDKALAFYGLISKTRMNLVLVDPDQPKIFLEDLVLDLPDEAEFIVRPIYFSKSGDEVRAVLEAGQKLYGFVKNASGEIRSFKQELPRTTFFGQLITQVNTVLSDPSSQNWIYVDDTQVNANSIRIQSLLPGQGFATQLKNSFSIDPSCFPLNPVRWTHNDSYRIQVLCKGEEGLELLSLPIWSKAN